MARIMSVDEVKEIAGKYDPRRWRAGNRTVWLQKYSYFGVCQAHGITNLHISQIEPYALRFDWTPDPEAVVVLDFSDYGHEWRIWDLPPTRQDIKRGWYVNER